MTINTVINEIMHKLTIIGLCLICVGIGGYYNAVQSSQDLNVTLDFVVSQGGYVTDGETKYYIQKIGDQENNNINFTVVDYDDKSN